MSKIKAAGALIPLILVLSGCSVTPDAMPPTQVDIFVLDLSTSNDKASQLRRLNEDLNKSLTSNGLGVPKPISNEIVSGPVTTIFTFIEEAATKTETFKIQDAESTIKLWNNEFAKDKERNAKGWLQISNAYSSYLQQKLNSPNSFSNSECQRDLDENLRDKYRADSKRGRIVGSLCEKIGNLVTGFSSMQLYVSSKQAPQTDIFGMLSRIDRLVEQIKKQDPNSVITVNIGSDMQHETGDLRDTPAKLRGANFEREKACALGREDRKKAGLSFDESSIVKVSGIGNAQISAEFGNALVRYWECYLPSAEIR
jgi:hypothetical protein